MTDSTECNSRYGHFEHHYGIMVLKDGTEKCCYCKKEAKHLK